ncbi:hypothetical protein [Clostridium algidicarnis]|uniref:hypothetical protein n=1 Tax=Clostridium algidicarnis TaxID=37659 RepID=UPI001C0CDD6E|nr:hypothetical protein [Clostridium algidicarnis]MBU3203961.1 hypothetical protein [Clostridium algidicarnis]MBU3212115.1 hypothetical protein [Clostridium algidicarnis]MBU3221380.1 hypothetical protein [Clostridium algidicarnis]
MFKVLEYVAIVAAIIGVIYLSLFCENIIKGKKEKTLKFFLRALIFLGAFGIYVVIVVVFKIPFF